MHCISTLVISQIETCSVLGRFFAVWTLDSTIRLSIVLGYLPVSSRDSRVSPLLVYQLRQLEGIWLIFSERKNQRGSLTMVGGLIRMNSGQKMKVTATANTHSIRDHVTWKVTASNRAGERLRRTSYRETTVSWQPLSIVISALARILTSRDIFLPRQRRCSFQLTSAITQRCQSNVR